MLTISTLSCVAGLNFSGEVETVDQNEQELPVFQSEDESNGEEIAEDEVSWEEALEILNSGEVTAIYQLHNLEVTLELKDGTSIKTIEPNIDAIFQEIDNCGVLCSNIIRATE